MRMILWFVVMMCGSEIALAQSTTATAPVCFDLPPGTDKAVAFIIWALAMVASRGMAEGIGFVVARWGTSAGRIVTAILGLLRLLGWLLGKIGWGQPENAMVKHLVIKKPDVVESDNAQVK